MKFWRTIYNFSTQSLVYFKIIQKCDVLFSCFWKLSHQKNLISFQIISMILNIHSCTMVQHILFFWFFLLLFGFLFLSVTLTVDSEAAPHLRSLSLLFYNFYNLRDSRTQLLIKPAYHHVWGNLIRNLPWNWPQHRDSVFYFKGEKAFVTM